MKVAIRASVVDNRRWMIDIYREHSLEEGAAPCYVWVGAHTWPIAAKAFLLEALKIVKGLILVPKFLKALNEL